MARLSRRAAIILAAATAVAAAGVTAALAGPIIYRDLMSAPAAEAPTASGESLAPATIDADALAGEWLIADGSFAGYRVNEVLNGTDVTVTGRTDTVSGTVTTTESAVTAAMITVDVASIATDSPNRDSYFRDTALRVSQHPTATFELTSPIVAPAGADVLEPQLVDSTGLLTLAGVSTEVTVRLSTAADGGTIRIAGSVPITFADYGVTAPSLGFVKVEETGVVEFLLVLVPGAR